MGGGRRPENESFLRNHIRTEKEKDGCWSCVACFPLLLILRDLVPGTVVEILLLHPRKMASSRRAPQRYFAKKKQINNAHFVRL